MSAPSPQEEQENLQALIRSVDAVEGWLARARQPTWFTPATGSELAGDDAVSDPFQVSHAVASAIGVAVEHADALRRLLRPCQSCHPGQFVFGLNSTYSLLRATLENAARAIWILGPDDRSERVLRRLRLQADNIHNSDNFAQAARLAPPKPRQARLDRLREIAAKAGLEPSRATKRTSNVEIIHGAGTHIDPTGDIAQHLEALWRSCSGAAHGDIWAGLSIHDKDVVHRSGNVATLQVTASTRLLTTITAETFDLVTLAHATFDRRNRSS